MSVRSLRYNTIEQHFTKSALASTDRDALAFLEAAQIYNTNQQRAIVNLVRSLKRVGLWSKMKAIYPFIGGTATSHKWNLKDPRDVDAAFRLTFSGGWTHSSTGADPNGTNAWADTFVMPSTNLATDSTHVSYYSRQNTANTGVLLGTETQSSSAFKDSIFIQPAVGGRTYSNVNSAVLSNIYIDVADANAAAYYIAIRASGSAQSVYRNSTLLESKTAVSTGVANVNISFASLLRNNSRGFYSDKQVAFATIGDGLTDTEAGALYNIVDLYQKRLGRAV